MKKILKLDSWFILLGSSLILVATITNESISLKLTTNDFTRTFTTKLPTLGWIDQNATRIRIYGTIFEDSRGNLWANGYDSLLQKLSSQKVLNFNERKSKQFHLTFHKCS